MRKNTIYSILAAAAVAMTTAGCADDTFDKIKGYDEDRDMTLTLRLPAFASVGTRAMDENALADVKVYFLDSTGSEVANESVTPARDGSATKVKLTVPAGTTQLKLYGNFETYCSESDPLTTSVDPNAQNYLPFYGEAGVQDLEDGGTIDMLRACAKSTIEVGDDVELTITSAKLYNAPKSGMMIGKVSENKSVPNVPTDVVKDNLSATVSAGVVAPYYHYEAEAGECFWVINTDKGWYKIAFIEKSDDEYAEAGKNAEELPILRNHHYQFQIEKVNHDGYATEAEAAAAPSENRLSVLLTDHNETIYDMISCRDYYLGVSEQNFVEASVGDRNAVVEGSFEFVTNYKGYITLTGDALLNALDLAKLPDWVTIDPKCKESFTITRGTSTDDSDGWKFVVKFKIPDNVTGNERQFTVPVKIGDLVREVTITQNGANYFDGENGIMVGIKNFETAGLSKAYPLPDKVGTLPSVMKTECQNYFAILSNEVRGETADEMGEERGNGLHFSVYVANGKSQYEYYIKNTGGTDTAEILEGNEYFEVTSGSDAGGNYWKISCKPAGNENYKIWKGSLRVTQSGKEIVYNIYHTGIIHNLVDTYQVAGPDGDKKTGLFYYEQVDVKGSDGQTYHILDRNLGASSNKPYSTTSSFNSANTDSRGPYLYIPQSNATSNPGTSDVVEATFPAGYTFPEVYHLANMGLQVFNGSEGSYGWNTENGSLLSRIYLPTAGTMEGSTNAENTRCYIWSNSMVVGNQGFYEGEKEYGQWFRTLECYGSSVDYTKMTRIISRATGLYKGVQVRAIGCPPAVPGWELPTVAEGRSRVILYNTANWIAPKITTTGATNGNGNVTNEKMQKGDDEGSWFYIDLRGVPTQANFIGSGVSTGNISLVYEDGIAFCDNGNSEEALPDPIRVYVNLVDVSFVPRIYYDGWEEVSWEGRVSMTAVEGQSNWYYHDISGDATKIKITDQGTGYEYGDKSLSDPDVSNCKNTHVLVLTYNNNWSVTGTTTPSFGGGGDTPTPGDTKTYRLYWYKSYDNYDMKWIYFWNLSSSISSNNGFKQGTAESDNYYYEFKVADSAGDFTINCLVNTHNRFDNNDSSIHQSRDFTNIQKSDFTLENGIYKKKLY